MSIQKQLSHGEQFPRFLRELTTDTRKAHISLLPACWPACLPADIQNWLNGGLASTDVGGGRSKQVFAVSPSRPLPLIIGLFRPDDGDDDDDNCRETQNAN